MMTIIEKIIEQQGADSTTVQAMQQFSPVIEKAEAALQSQDREDAERYRWLRSAGKETERIVEDMYECALSGDDLDAAIDRARRIEGGSHE